MHKDDVYIAVYKEEHGEMEMAELTHHYHDEGDPDYRMWNTFTKWLGQDRIAVFHLPVPGKETPC